MKKDTSMITRFRSILITAALVALASPVFAQTILNTTTLSAAIDNTQTRITLGSTANIAVTGVTSPQVWLFVPQSGELMAVLNVPSSGVVQVVRGTGPTRAYAAPTSATVIIVTSPQAVIGYTPQGTCTRGSGLFLYSPLINANTGEVVVCRSSLVQTTKLTLTTFNSVAPFTP